MKERKGEGRDRGGRKGEERDRGGRKGEERDRGGRECTYTTKALKWFSSPLSRSLGDDPALLQQVLLNRRSVHTNMTHVTQCATSSDKTVRISNGLKPVVM